jgi:hypothetical protein
MIKNKENFLHREKREKSSPFNPNLLNTYNLIQNNFVFNFMTFLFVKP